jgi:hypothetical protein
MAAFVLGNGLSRSQISVDHLQQRAPVYGCNALYRTHRPWVLVATDKHIAEEIQQSGYAHSNLFYTRRPLPDSGARAVPREYFGFSSGPIAVALAAQDRHDPIYLLGFDMGPNQLGRFNNVYAGTEFYKPVHSEPTFVGNWCRQLRRVMADHPNQTFVRVMGSTTASIAELDDIDNLKPLPIEQFLQVINNHEAP